MTYTKTTSIPETWYVTVAGNRPNIGFPGFATLRSAIVPYTLQQTGQKVEGWKNKVQQGESAGSPYSCDSVKVSKRKDFDVTLLYHFGAEPFGNRQLTFSGNGTYDGSIVNHLAPYSSEVGDEALKKIIKKIQSKRQELNGLAFVGELREAIHGLRHPYLSMREQTLSHLGKLNKRKLAVDKMPKLKRKEAWRKIVADTWLETVFGMLPLVHDVKDIATALARFQFEEPLVTRLQSKAVAFQDEASVVPGGYGDFFYSFYTGRVRQTRSVATYSVGIDFKHGANASADRLLETLGFSLENFVPGLYEVAPWSWLIDYFSNLGDMIQAGTFSHSGIRWISKTIGQITTEQVISATSFPLTLANMGGFTLDDIQGELHGTATVSRATLTRTIPSQLGIPDLHLTYPGKFKQQANMLAIMAQFSGRTYDPKMANRLFALYPPAKVRNRGVRRASDFLN